MTVLRLGPVQLGPVASAYVLFCLTVLLLLALWEHAW